MLAVRRVSLLLAIIFGLYVMAGFLLVPYVVRHSASDIVAGVSGQILQIENIGFNPFSFDLNLHDIVMKSPTAKIHAEVKHVDVQLDIWSILSDTVVLKKLHVDTANIYSDVSSGGDLLLFKPFIQSPQLSDSPSETSEAGILLLIKDLSVKESLFSLRKQGSESDNPLILGPLSIDINDFTTLKGQSFDLSDLQVGVAGGEVSLVGGITALPLSGNLDFKLNNIELERVNEFAVLLNKAVAGVDHISGILNLSGSIAFNDEIRATADLDLTKLTVRESEENSTFLSSAQIALKNIDVRHSLNLSGTEIGIERLEVIQPHMNVKRLMHGGFLIPTIYTSEPVEDDVNDESAGTSAINAPKLNIKQLDITDGSLLFEDRMALNNHSVTIDMMSFHAGAIEFPFYDAQNKTQFEAYARIGGQGQLEVEGASRFDMPYGLEARLTLDRLSYNVIVPYIRQYLGRDVEEGELFLDLNYQIPSAEVVGANIFLFNDWKWGRRVESNDAVDMPLELAFSLLEDRDGRVKFDVPITGDLTDPSFEIGPIIQKATGNLLTGLISSPFTLLGKLIPSGSNGVDLSTVYFDMDTVELSATEKAKLSSLAASLKERPRFNMSVMCNAYENSETANKTEVDNDTYLENTSLSPVLKADIRAQAIVSFLSNAGTDKNRLLIQSLPPNASTDGSRAKCEFDIINN
jgi:hypothetical protein